MFAFLLFYKYGKHPSTPGPLHLLSPLLKCPSPRHPHGLLSQLFHVSVQVPSYQWGLFQPPHLESISSTSAFTIPGAAGFFFIEWYIKTYITAYVFVYSFVCFPQQEFKLRENRAFCLFLSALYHWHLEQNLAKRRCLVSFCSVSEYLEYIFKIHFSIWNMNLLPDYSLPQPFPHCFSMHIIPD